MSVRIMALVFDVDPDRLTSTEKLVLLALADHANDEGRHIYPGVERLARKCSLSDRGVDKTIKSLRAKNVLVPVKIGGGKLATEYRINVSALVDMISPPTRGERGSLVGGNVVPPRGERGSPQPSYNHHKNQEDKSSSAGGSEDESENPPEKSEGPPDPLAPATPGAQEVFGLLAREASAKSRRAPKRFRTLAQKEAFEAAEKRLGKAELLRAVTKALEMGISGIPNLTAYVGKWRGGSARPPANGKTKEVEQKMSGVISLEGV